MTDSLVIDAQGLCKRYGSHTVLAGASLAVRAGEVAVIVGPSGGGKSTLLRCFNALETFDEGRLQVVGQNLPPGPPTKATRHESTAIRRRVGMVFQQFHLFPHRSVLGNVIEAPLHVLGESRAAATAHAHELLARVGLADKSHQSPETLSGGQQQRVAIARALAMRPEVLLFDEPTSALDPSMAAEVEAVIADLAAAGQTMVVVTHSLQLARRAAHTLYVLAEGRVIESGPPEQLFSRPQHPATAKALHLS